jgi:general secretion pathway protein A
MKWLAHWGLNEPPFTKEIGDANLWVPSSREPLVEEIVEACTERGHALLTGEPGVGKTCVLRALRQRLPEAGFRLTYCHNATLGRRDFYRHVCLSLGLETHATAAAVFYTIATHVQQLGKDKVHPVLTAARTRGNLAHDSGGVSCWPDLQWQSAPEVLRARG